VLQAHGQLLRYFRPPYFDSGETLLKKEAFDRFLADHRYRVAPFTVQDQDWMFNASYDEARRLHNNDVLARVRAAYLAQVENELNHAEELARNSFHRDIPQVMFMHSNLLNAEMLDSVLNLIESHGYQFISLDEALRDSAYHTPDAFVGSAALSWLDRWQPALGRPIRSAEPNPPAWARQNYRRITATLKRERSIVH